MAADAAGETLPGAVPAFEWTATAGAGVPADHVVGSGARARSRHRFGPAVRSVDEPGVARSRYRDLRRHETEGGTEVRQANSPPPAAGASTWFGA